MEGRKKTWLLLAQTFSVCILTTVIFEFLRRMTVQTEFGSLVLFRDFGLGRGFDISYLGVVFNWIADFNGKIMDDWIGNAAVLWRHQLLNLLYIICGRFAVGVLLEEVQWRGFFWLTRRYCDKWWWNVSFLISVVLFGLYHNRSIGFIIPPMAVAAASWVLVRKTGRFWPVLLNHFMFNVTLVLL